MVNEMNILSGVRISNDEFQLLVRELGGIGGRNFNDVQKIFDGVSNVWVRLTELTSDIYDDEDLSEIRSLLHGEVESFVKIEYDDGETAVERVLSIVSVLSDKYPIVLDNCYGRIYRFDEIKDLVLKGEF